MIASITFLLGVVTLSFASPVEIRAVTELNQEAFEEAHQRDDGATRAFSSSEIKTSDGQCLFVDELSGDFRANLTPIQIAACDGSEGQLWDIITSGTHNDQAGKMLVVNTLTQACLDFNQGRTGREITAFSCGGRADGGGQVSQDQLFPFSGVGPFSLTTDRANDNGLCVAVSGSFLGPAPCSQGDASQSFTLGGDVTEALPDPTSPASVSSAPASPTPTSAEVLVPESSSPCISTTLVTVTRGQASAVETSAESATSAIQATEVATSTSDPSTEATTSAVQTSVAETITSVDAPAQVANPTSPVPVSRAGGVLNPTLAAEANTRDDTATRAFSSVSIRSSSGQCLFVDPTAGDFRQNLIPVQVQDCTGSANEKFDLITSGIHNNKAGTTLVVSSLMQGCLNFDRRRAPGDTVMIFSCGGRAAGEGGTTDDQLFEFNGGAELVLSRSRREGENTVTTCLVPVGGKLDSTTACTGDAQVFSIV